MNYEIVRRAAEKIAFCRGCDKKIQKGEDLIYTYSRRCQGQHIYFCLKCAQKISELVAARQSI